MGFFHSVAGLRDRNVKGHTFCFAFWSSALPADPAHGIPMLLDPFQAREHHERDPYPLRAGTPVPTGTPPPTSRLRFLAPATSFGKGIWGVPACGFLGLWGFGRGNFWENWCEVFKFKAGLLTSVIWCEHLPLTNGNLPPPPSAKICYGFSQSPSNPFHAARMFQPKRQLCLFMDTVSVCV